MRRIWGHWPLLVASAILMFVLPVLLVLCIRGTQGHFAYVLDDPYIHMAIAKNFAETGVWGLGTDSFTATSSPLWTLLLSLSYTAVGANAIAPFALNVLFAVLVLGTVYVLLNRSVSGFRYSRPYVFVVLLAMLFLVPLPALIFGGMEHTLHVLVTIVFVYLSAKAVSQEGAKPAQFSMALIFAALVTAVRFEGLFPIFMVCGLLVAYKRRREAVLIAVAGAFPVVVHGLVSLSKGWYFLPNSVLLKSNRPHFSCLADIVRLSGYTAVRTMLEAPHMFVLLLAAACLTFVEVRRRDESRRPLVFMLLVFIGAALLHMQFARLGWFYRYEAYLVALSLLGIAMALPLYLNAWSERLVGWKECALGVGVLLLCLLPLFVRGATSLAQIPVASRNIYEQQCQMGAFLKRFYEGQGVAANDVGAINYFARTACLDLTGVTSMDVTRLKAKGIYNTLAIYRLARDKRIKIAIVYDAWFPKGDKRAIPPEWIRAGTWTIADNVICGDATVTFYAVDPSEKDSLAARLKAFGPGLPKDVTQEGEYLAGSRRAPGGEKREGLDKERR